MIEDIIKDADSRMIKSVDAMKVEMSKVRTGRANANLLDHVTVDYYGSEVPISQVGNISAQDARTLVISVWDKSAIASVEKAIMHSDLGLNPQTAGEVIRVPLPPLTEERRKELIKVVRAEAEKAKVAIRNIRRDANQSFKDLIKEKSISEDDEHRAEERIQKITDNHVMEIDNLLEAKEKEMMEI
ncbi:MAG: ribosome recycling factor [Gammaproteobacteria bacterium]|nr:ribosome recycling factor [Gammaproteobacteria bacterium]NIN62660.1 ribosome recycling factor [Gammaproteobacteria bacterium]NIO63198.1 ribosome recycling factor [Gammaproteobacteria bacterium]NIQ11306.1 ribosome recycling factor [Gammaproteobacteria bacterium]NIQ20298.1 ribosome recycling factor [Gammaproteobacteria bacterium]